MIITLINNNINLVNYYFSNMFFNLIHLKFNTIFDRKMANNFTALVHAVGCTFLAGNYLRDKTSSNYDMLKIYSSGYFTYDLFLILKYWKSKTINYAYLYHHLASLYLMQQNPILYKSAHIFFFAELSNIPSYFVYYFQKQNPKNHSLIKKLKYLQFFMYSLIRVPIIGKILYDGYNSGKENKNYLPFLMGSPVFLMGIIWSKKLFDKLEN